MNIVGIDIGFGFTKATNGSKQAAFKSIYGEAQDIQFREQLLGSTDAASPLHLSIDGQEYFIGELAERQSTVRSFTLDQDQFITGFTRIMAVAALAQVAEPNSTVHVVSGLPISFYRRHHEELAKQLKGQHKIAVHNASGKLVPSTVTVADVRVIPQPVGSLVNLMLGNGGEVAGKAYAQGKIGIIDVGFRTCDFTIVDRTRYSERGSATTNGGMSQAYSAIANKLKDQTGINIELYRLHDAIQRGSIKVRSKQINLEPLVEDAYKQLASAIAAESERMWADDWDIDSIVVTGGGGAVLLPYIKPLLQGDVVLPGDGNETRFSNVQGYLKYGRKVWSREAAPAAATPG